MGSSKPSRGKPKHSPLCSPRKTSLNFRKGFPKSLPMDMIALMTQLLWINMYRWYQSCENADGKSSVANRWILQYCSAMSILQPCAHAQRWRYARLISLCVYGNVPVNSPCTLNRRPRIRSPMLASASLSAAHIYILLTPFWCLLQILEDCI